MNAKQIIGLIGSILVIAGCFLPIIRVPIIGGISYVLPRGETLVMVSLWRYWPS